MTFRTQNPWLTRHAIAPRDATRGLETDWMMAEEHAECAC